MTFGRDSWLWILSILAAVLVYLGASDPPTAWSYAQWVQFAAFLVATLSGKLSSSPLPRGDR